MRRAGAKPTLTAAAGAIKALAAMALILLGALPAAAPTATAQSAGDRAALVIGVETYQNNPSRVGAVRSARRVADQLQRLGFSVTTVLDPSEADLARATRAFAAQPRAAVSLIYVSAMIDQRGDDVLLLAADAPPAGDGALARPSLRASSLLRAAAVGADASIVAFDVTGAARALERLAAAVPANQLVLASPLLGDMAADGAAGETLFARALARAFASAPETVGALAERFDAALDASSAWTWRPGAPRASAALSAELAATPFAAAPFAGDATRGGAGRIGASDDGLLSAEIGDRGVPIARPPVIDRGGELTIRPARPERAANETPPYPWPPETPSSIARLDRFFADLRGQTLGAVAARLTRAMIDADYADHRFYAAPGGFVLATRLEEIDGDGAPLPGGGRYRLPEDPRTDSFAAYLRGLFLRAPPDFWRYIAVVSTDQNYRPNDEDALGSAEALDRLGGGVMRLSEEIEAAPFGERHRVEALIYEFRKAPEEATAQLLAPGRIPPSIHLEKTGLADMLENAQ